MHVSISVVYIKHRGSCTHFVFCFLLGVAYFISQELADIITPLSTYFLLVSCLTKSKDTLALAKSLKTLLHSITQSLLFCLPIPLDFLNRDIAELA
jgi:hypothetical protein